jgi:hypothetical protein
MSRFATILLLTSLLAAPGALARDQYREPQPFPPATGPDQVAVDGSTVAEVGKLSKRQRRKNPEAPPLLVELRDESGRPVEGAVVQVGLKIGKRRAHWKGVTARDGRFAFRPTGVAGTRRIDLDLSWDGGTKEIGVDIEPDGRKWALEKPRYRNVASADWEGDCGNLFSLDQEEQGLFVQVVKPDSLLGCRRVDYGLDRKSDAMSRLDEIGRRDVNEGDKNSFGPDDEAKMGVEAAAHFDKQFERISDPVITGYVQRLVERIVANSDAPDMPVNLRVVHTEGINAFATAGGNVYVFTGLIAAAENEAQLAGVLSHEVSHVIARHVTEGASRQMKTQGLALLASLGLAAAADMDRDQTEAVVQGAMVGAGLYGMKHGRAAETEADLLGAQYLWKAGWDPESIARFFEVLEREGGASPPGWLSTHPTHERRIENGLHWSRAFLPQQERYLVNTDEFARVKDRVRSLPAPKKRPPAETEAAGFASLYAGTDAFNEVAMRQWGNLLGEGSR